MLCTYLNPLKGLNSLLSFLPFVVAQGTSSHTLRGGSIVGIVIGIIFGIITILSLVWHAMRRAVGIEAREVGGEPFGEAVAEENAAERMRWPGGTQAAMNSGAVPPNMANAYGSRSGMGAGLGGQGYPLNPTGSGTGNGYAMQGQPAAGALGGAGGGTMYGPGSAYGNASGQLQDAVQSQNQFVQQSRVPLASMQPGTSGMSGQMAGGMPLFQPQTAQPPVQAAGLQPGMNRQMAGGAPNMYANPAGAGMGMNGGAASMMPPAAGAAQGLGAGAGGVPGQVGVGIPSPADAYLRQQGGAAAAGRGVYY